MRQNNDYYGIAQNAIIGARGIDLQYLKDSFLPTFLKLYSDEQRSELMKLAAETTNFEICKLLIEHGIPFNDQAKNLFVVSNLSYRKFNRQGWTPQASWALENWTAQINQWRNELSELSDKKFASNLGLSSSH